MRRKAFDVDDVIRDAGLQSMGVEDFDSLPFGTIRLDARNRVTLYNAAEAELARLEQDSAIGLDFFRDIAPCTDNEKFRGLLEEMVRTGKTTARFDYRFLFKWGARAVRIQFWVPEPDLRWIFVLPHEGEDLNP